MLWRSLLAFAAPQCTLSAAILNLMNGKLTIARSKFRSRRRVRCLVLSGSRFVDLRMMSSLWLATANCAAERSFLYRFKKSSALVREPAPHPFLETFSSQTFEPGHEIVMQHKRPPSQLPAHERAVP
jgi:hypothetical protein